MVGWLCDQIVKLHTHTHTHTHTQTHTPKHRHTETHSDTLSETDLYIHSNRLHTHTPLFIIYLICLILLRDLQGEYLSLAGCVSVCECACVCVCVSLFCDSSTMCVCVWELVCFWVCHNCMSLTMCVSPSVSLLVDDSVSLSLCVCVSVCVSVLTILILCNVGVVLSSLFTNIVVALIQNIWALVFFTIHKTCDESS